MGATALHWTPPRRRNSSLLSANVAVIHHSGHNLLNFASIYIQLPISAFFRTLSVFSSPYVSFVIRHRHCTSFALLSSTRYQTTPHQDPPKARPRCHFDNRDIHLSPSAFATRRASYEGSSCLLARRTIFSAEQQSPAYRKYCASWPLLPCASCRLLSSREPPSSDAPRNSHLRTIPRRRTHTSTDREYHHSWS